MSVGRAVPLIRLPCSLVFQQLCDELQPTPVGKLSFYLKKKKKRNPTLFPSCVKTTAHIFPQIRSASRKSGFQLCSPILTATNGSILKESWFLQWRNDENSFLDLPEVNAVNSGDHSTDERKVPRFLDGAGTEGRCALKKENRKWHESTSCWKVSIRFSVLSMSNTSPHGPQWP